MKKIIFCFILLLIVPLSTFAQFKDAFFTYGGFVLPYQISFPENYDQNKQYPLVLFLHGAGERGIDNEKQLTHGEDFLLENTQSKYPSIVIVPQCPEMSYWSCVKSNTGFPKRSFDFSDTENISLPMKTLIALVNDWLSSGYIDTKQVYVGGLSMGGMGTFEILWRMPNIFTAAFPVCGGGNVEKAKSYAKNTALWIFHGADDVVVPVEHSINMYNELKKSGCDVKYTEYPGVNHNSWDNVFQETELFPWLFSHRK